MKAPRGGETADRCICVNCRACAVRKSSFELLACAAGALYELIDGGGDMERGMYDMDCLALNVRAWFVTKSSTGAFELGGVRKLVMDGGGEMSRGI